MVYIHARKAQQRVCPRRKAHGARKPQLRRHRVRAGKQNKTMGNSMVMDRLTSGNGKYPRHVVKDRYPNHIVDGSAHT